MSLLIQDLKQEKESLKAQLVVAILQKEQLFSEAASLQGNLTNCRFEQSYQVSRSQGLEQERDALKGANSEMKRELEDIASYLIEVQESGAMQQHYRAGKRKTRS